MMKRWLVFVWSDQREYDAGGPFSLVYDGPFENAEDVRLWTFAYVKDKTWPVGAAAYCTDTQERVKFQIIDYEELKGDRSRRVIDNVQVAEADTFQDTGLRTGRWVGIEFTRIDGSTYRVGSWQVPHDADPANLVQQGGDLGYHIMYEMARQDPLPIVNAQIITWEKK